MNKIIKKTTIFIAAVIIFIINCNNMGRLYWHFKQQNNNSYKC